MSKILIEHIIIIETVCFIMIFIYPQLRMLSLIIQQIFKDPASLFIIGEEGLEKLFDSAMKELPTKIFIAISLPLLLITFLLLWLLGVKFPNDKE